MNIPGTNLDTNQAMEMYITFQIASALVQSLPVPAQNGNVIYATIFKFLSLIIADFKGFMSKSVPSLTTTSSTVETVAASVSPSTTTITPQP